MPIHWQQVGRAARIFGFALVAQFAAFGTAELDRHALISIALAALEVTYRQLVPVDVAGREPDKSSDAVQ